MNQITLLLILVLYKKNLIIVPVFVPSITTTFSFSFLLFQYSFSYFTPSFFDHKC
ncbi:hypothetical protein RIR_e2051_A0A2N1MG16_9GLOM [Rhizophagus irregularis DAOM 181602=DAOM 197198]|nr:hypothetical protein RIR_e2051_A0A2N1MG16_9GLOM [Rhizophagus irregularis DAOM 181602=DAOM 197198]